MALPPRSAHPSPHSWPEAEAKIKNPPKRVSEALFRLFLANDQGPALGRLRRLLDLCLRTDWAEALVHELIYLILYVPCNGVRRLCQVFAAEYSHHYRGIFRPDPQYHVLGHS